MVAKQDLPDLLDLVRLRLGMPWLRVKYLLDSVARENVMVAADAFLETQTSEQPAEAIERHVGIRPPQEYVFVEFPRLAHDMKDSTFQGRIKEMCGPLVPSSRQGSRPASSP